MSVTTLFCTKAAILFPMSRTLIIRISAGILALLGAWAAYTQNKQAPPRLDVHKIKDDLYMIETVGPIAGNVTDTSPMTA